MNTYSKLSVLLCVGLFIGCAAKGSDGKGTEQSLAKNEVATKEAAAPAASSVATVESVSAAKSGKATDFAWKADGKTVSFSEFTKGKVTFLNFWATWCPPCRREIPDIIEISK